MSKRIQRISTLQYSALVEQENWNKHFVGEIDGKAIKNMEDYIAAVWRAFRFPHTGHMNYYAYLDWIRDLDWLDAESYTLVIHDFNSFMEKFPREKETVIRSLENNVIPWWESGIEQFQVGGKAKPFDVYLVD